MAVNYTDVQKTEKYISRTNFDALEMAAVPEGTEFNIVDQIHESDLDSDVLQKLNNNAKINTANTFTAAQTFKKDITIEGNIIQNGSAYETHAEKLYTKNDMIFTRDGATAALADNAYTGIQAVKYDGTNDGQLVFGKDGVARVGDIGNTQPLATRAEAGALTDGHVLQWDAAGQTLVDSGKSVEDFATINDIPDTSKFAKLTDLARDPAKTYLVWKGNQFPNSTNAKFKAPAGCTIDWGDGNVETFSTASTVVNTHNYTDGIEYHLISLSNYTVVDSAVFPNCSGLTSVIIGNGVTSIGGSAFQGCSGLTSITIPNSVTSIGRSAFANCSGLTNIIIPNSVTSMDRGAFVSCSKLTSVTISNGVTSIIANAFMMCSELTSITIPDGVTSIGDFAFNSCNKLKKVIIKATSVPTLSSSSFPNSIEKIVVPKSAINAYKAASNWSSYADKIVYEVDSSDLSSGGGDVTAAGSNIFTGLNSFRLNTTFGGSGESASDPIITVDSGAIRFRYNGLFDCGQLVADNANDKNLTYKYNDAVVKFPKKSGTIAIIGDLPVANPTAEGTTVLTKLKVGDVVYTIPNGGSGGVTSVTTSGTGNAVTAASISGNTLTLTKGSTFALITDIPNTSNFVTLSGAQTISGNKTFNNHISLTYGPEGYIDFGNNWKFFGYYMNNGTGTSFSFPSGKNGTIALTDDIPIKSATLSDNDTTLTLVLK